MVLTFLLNHPIIPGPCAFQSDPYLVFKRMMPDGTPVKVFESQVGEALAMELEAAVLSHLCLLLLQVIKSTLNPVWPEVELSLQVLCNGDMNAKIYIDCLGACVLFFKAFHWQKIQWCLGGAPSTTLRHRLESQWGAGLHWHGSNNHEHHFGSKHALVAAPPCCPLLYPLASLRVRAAESPSLIPKSKRKRKNTKIAACWFSALFD